jgi:hypothetical protein
MRNLVALGLALLTALLVLVAAPSAAAGDDDREVIRRGGCSGAADWKLKTKRDDGGLEVEFEVDQNRNSQRWRVVLRRDGNRFFRGIRTTRRPSGSFEVERHTRNGAGRDRIVGRAVNLRSGQVCRGALTF